MKKGLKCLLIVIVAILFMMPTVAFALDDCTSESDTAVGNWNNGMWECEYYGNGKDNRGKAVLVVRNCKLERDGELQIKYYKKGESDSYDTKGWTFNSDTGSITSFESYKSAAEMYGCPVHIETDDYVWGPWDEARMRIDFKTPDGKENFSSSTSLKEHDFDGFLIRNIYYDTIIESLNVNNPVVSTYLNGIISRLSSNFIIGSSAIDNVFSVNNAGLPKNYTMKYYDASNGKDQVAVDYSSVVLEGTDTATLNSRIETMKADANKLIALGNDYISFVNYISVAENGVNVFDTAYSNLLSECHKGIIEGDSAQVAFITSNNASDNTNKVNESIEDLVSGAPSDKKQYIKNVGNSCNQYAKHFQMNSEKTSPYLKFLENITLLHQEMKSLSKALSYAKNIKNTNEFDDLIDALNNIIANATNVDDVYNDALTVLKAESFDYGVGDEVNCKSLIGSEMMDYLNTIYFLIEIAAVVLTVILSMTDFSKAIVSSDAEALKKSWKRVITRLIMVVVIVLLPVLIEFVINVFGIKGIDPDHPICIQENTGNSEGE